MTSLLLATLLASARARAAAPAPAPAAKAIELPGQDVDLKAADGWVLKARYREVFEPGKLTLVLLHGRGMRKESWLRLARALSKAGLGYFALDLRGHGESQIGPDGQSAPWRAFKAKKNDNDYANMALDVQAAVAYLTTQEGVAEETIGLIGEDLGGSIALKYAAVHPKTPLLVMLSPGLAYQEIPIVNAVRAYKDRPVLMIYGELDRNASRAAPILYEFAKRSAGENNATLVSIPNTHGAKLLSSAVVKQIVEWLRNPVKPETPPEVSTETLEAPQPDILSAPDDSPQ